MLKNIFRSLKTINNMNTCMELQMYPYIYQIFNQTAIHSLGAGTTKEQFKI